MAGLRSVGDELSIIIRQGGPGSRSSNTKRDWSQGKNRSKEAQITRGYNVPATDGRDRYGRRNGLSLKREVPNHAKGRCDPSGNTFRRTPGRETRQHRPVDSTALVQGGGIGGGGGKGNLLEGVTIELSSRSGPTLAGYGIRRRGAQVEIRVSRGLAVGKKGVGRDDRGKKNSRLVHLPTNLVRLKDGF